MNGEGGLKECQQYILILKCTWHLKISPRGCNLNVEMFSKYILYTFTATSFKISFEMQTIKEELYNLDSEVTYTAVMINILEKSIRK